MQLLIGQNRSIKDSRFPCYLKADHAYENFCKQKWGRAKGIPLLSESSQYATLLLGKTISMVQTFFGKTKILFGFLSISKTGTKVGLNVMWCHGNFWKVGDTCIPLASAGGNSVRAPSSRTSTFPGKSPRLLGSTSLSTCPSAFTTPQVFTPTVLPHAFPDHNSGPRSLCPTKCQL